MITDEEWKLLDDMKAFLKEKKEHHKEMAEVYGSELASGEMISQEKAIEDKIISYSRQLFEKDMHQFLELTIKSKTEENK